MEVRTVGGSTGPLSSFSSGPRVYGPVADHHQGPAFMCSSTFGPQLPSMPQSESTRSVDLPESNETFAMGKLFPFVPFSFPSPAASVSPPPPSSSPCRAPVSVSPLNPCLGGSLFPFLSLSAPLDRAESPVHHSLALWIASHGGRLGFSTWLANLASEVLEASWRQWPSDKVWDELLGSGNRWLDVQVQAALESNPDVGESELNGLMVQAQSLVSATASRSRKRGRQGPSPIPLTGNLTRCQIRNMGRKRHRASVRTAKRKNKRRLACYRASDKFGVKKRHHLLIGTWNTRGLGAPFGKDPEGKATAIAKVLAERQWSCALLADVRFPEAGFYELSVGGAAWLVVHEGRVAVALNPFLASRWRAGGSVVVRARGWEGQPRAFGLSIPAAGWRPGLLLVPVYAPLVSKTRLEQREVFREQLSTILDFSSSRRRLVVGGGKWVLLRTTTHWRHVMGPYGDERRTKGGEELLHFCEQEQLMVAGTFTRQEHKATWYHNRWGTAHTLDHFLVRSVDRRWVRSV